MVGSHGCTAEFRLFFNICADRQISQKLNPWFSMNVFNCWISLCTISIQTVLQAERVGDSLLFINLPILIINWIAIMNRVRFRRLEFASSFSWSLKSSICFYCCTRVVCCSVRIWNSSIKTLEFSHKSHAIVLIHLVQESLSNIDRLIHLILLVLNAENHRMILDLQVEQRE